LDWDSIDKPILPPHEINAYSPLITRVDMKQIEALIEANKKPYK